MDKIEQDLNTEQLVGHYKKHIDKTYIGSHDLMADDGEYKSTTVEISAVHKRQIYNPGKKKHETRVIAALKGKEKMLILNATNLNTIERLTGTPMTQQWLGQSVLLTVERVKVGRDYKDAIRVKGKS